MTFRIVRTPLAAPVPMPPTRAGGMAASLRSAIVPASGLDAVLDRLARPNVLAVTTGQQPALFTGPLYTIHKALSAAALARQLERRWGRAVVPLFWVAADDHDFAEANHAAWLDADGEVRHATLRARPADAPMLPLYREPLGPEVETAVTALAGSLPATPFRDGAVEWIRRHFTPGATIAAASAAALAELLAPLGIACVDGTHPSVKCAAAPYLLRALLEAPSLDTALRERHDQLVRADRDPGVAVGDGATLVMIEAAAGRDRLVRDGDDFVTRRGGERFTRAEVERIATDAPERLSPNVILRPVIESALFPTVAYAAGPGELRYLPLARPVYGSLGVPRQEAVPRWSGTLVDSRTDRVLRKFTLTLDELALPPDALASRVVRQRLPEEADVALGGLRQDLEASYTRVRDVAGRVDPTLVRSVEGRRDRALDGLDRIERKLVTHLRRRMGIELGQLASAQAAIHPDGQPQERVLCVVSFLARGGPALLEQVRADADAWYGGALEAAPGPG